MLIYEFRTKNFTLTCEQVPEHDPDLSWDDTGEVQKMIDAGFYDLFCAKVSVTHKSGLSVSEYLGNCVYRTGEFVKPGSRDYFSSMVGEAIDRMRWELQALRNMPIKAA